MDEIPPNVLPFKGITRLNLPPDQVLEKAMGQLDSVIIIGYDKEEGHYFASSIADGGTCLWLVEKFKRELLSIGDE